MMVDFGPTHIYAGFAALVIAIVVLWRQSKSLSYLFFFSIFWMYMMGVAGVVVFPFPIGYPDPDFKPDINLIPFDFGSCELGALCIRNIYENILLTIPFGFGVSFIARINPRNIFWLAWTVGFTFELVQLVISFVIRSSFRVVDINDVILNAAGVLLGYGIFKIFGALYSAAAHKLQIQPRYIFAYIYDIVRRQD